MSFRLDLFPHDAELRHKLPSYYAYSDRFVAVGLISISFLAGVLVGTAKPTKLDRKDITGDGVEDVIVESESVISTERTFFIGTPDKHYIKAVLKKTGPLEYLLTSDGRKFIFDGQFYRLSKE